MKKNKKIFLIIITAIILLLIIIAGVLFLPQILRKSSDRIVLSNLSDDLKKQLESKYVYGSDLSQPIVYYSPNLKLTFKYTPMFFTLSESSTLMLMPTQEYGKNNNLDYGESISIYTKESNYESLVEENLDSYKRLYNYVNVLFQNEDSSSGLNYYRIEIERSKEYKILEKEEDKDLKTTDTLFFYILPDRDNEILVLKLTENIVTTFDIGEFLLTVDTNKSNFPTKVAKNILGTVEFEYNPQMWQTTFYDDKVYMSFEAADYELKNEEYKYFSTMLSIEVISLEYDITEDQRQKRLTETLEDTITSYSSKEGYSEGATKDTSIDNVNFKLVEFYIYSDTDFSKFRQKVSLYVGIVEDSIVKILSFEPPVETSANEQIQNILKSIQLTRDSISYNEENSIFKTIYADDNSITIEKGVLLAKPSVVHIFAQSCGTLTYNWSDNSTEDYKICTASEGTGFIISSDGYIATNGHVAALDNEETLIYSILYGYSYDFLYDLSSRVLKEEYGYEPSETDVSTFLDEIYNDESILWEIGIGLYDDYKNGYAQIGDFEKELYIQFPDQNDYFKFDSSNFTLANKSKFIPASLISTTYQPWIISYLNETDLSKPDLAIIKANGSIDEYQEVKISQNYLVGNSIYAIGYPGATEDLAGYLLSNSSSAIPTITKGTISAVKPNSSNDFDLIQIDASVSHGNSGGPLVNSNGEILGVITYAVSAEDSGGDYNFAISSKALNDLLQNSDITLKNSQLSELWTLIIENFSKGYYKKTIELLEKYEKMYPKNKDAILLRQISEDLISKGEDKTPIIDISDILKLSPLVFALAGVVCIFIVLVVSLLVIILRKPKQNVTFSTNNISSNYGNVPTQSSIKNDMIEESPNTNNLTPTETQNDINSIVTPVIESVPQKPENIVPQIIPTNPDSTVNKTLPEENLIGNTTIPQPIISESVINPQISQNDQTISENIDNLNTNEIISPNTPNNSSIIKPETPIIQINEVNSSQSNNNIPITSSTPNPKLDEIIEFLDKANQK